jgi:F-box protein 18 (helicase)
MQLTTEQKSILQSTQNITINAVAGSGKTTTLIEFAKVLSPQSSILYLAFNKSVKIEAEKKFKEANLQNVQVETAHSLAYKHVVYGNGYKVKSNSYTTTEIADLLALKGSNEKHTEYILANHVNKYMSFFCNSNVQKVQELNYSSLITDEKAAAFVNNWYNYIVQQTRLLLAKMNAGEIEVTHDFYLKKFQLYQPILQYNYIFFDEGQDASPAMLDIFLKQPAIKVMVGDAHQQIYGWRFAVNALEKTNFTQHHLSTSFRFPPAIARLAKEILQWKKHLTNFAPIEIIGKGDSKNIKTKAVIARTNLGLLLTAIEYLTEKPQLKSIYFEGNIQSYTYADDGASLYDVLNLYNGKHELIRDTLDKKMTSIDDLEEYIEQTEDVQLSMMVEIVKEYGNEIPGIIKRLKDKHIDGNDKSEAEIIFSTVHRCKGMEYDSIHLVNDFITEEKIIQLKENSNQQFTIDKILEEINLLYVAITRTKNLLYIPEKLLPATFISAPNIHVLKVLTKQEKEQAKQVSKGVKKVHINQTENIQKAYTISDKRLTHKSAYNTWNESLDDELRTLFHRGISMPEMANYFGRTKGAIYSRIKKLGLVE